MFSNLNPWKFLISALALGLTMGLVVLTTFRMTSRKTIAAFWASLSALKRILLVVFVFSIALLAGMFILLLGMRGGVISPSLFLGPPLIDRYPDLGDRIPFPPFKGDETQ